MAPRASAWLLPGLVAGPTLAVALSSVDVPGCLLRDYAFNKRIVGADGKPRDPIIVDNVQACQDACVADGECVDYGFFAEVSQCYLGAAGGKLEPRPGARAGHKACAVPVPDCTSSLPSAEFLTATNTEEAAAAWPSGYQPQALQCWPNFGISACATITVLEDTQDGWAGKCESLVKVDLVGQQTCQQNCVQDPTCSVWQLLESGQCWKGLGMNCFTDPTWELKLNRSQRLTRGEVRVLASLVGKKIDKGMLQVFDQENAKMAPDAAIACKNACLSLKACQFWQLRNSTGCFIEAPDAVRDVHWKANPVPAEYDSKPVPYPLVTANPSSTDADILAGEFLQRSCSTVLETPVPTVAPTLAPTLAPTISPTVFGAVANPAATAAPAASAVTAAPGIFGATAPPTLPPVNPQQAAFMAQQANAAAQQAAAQANAAQMQTTTTAASSSSSSAWLVWLLVIILLVACGAGVAVALKSQWGKKSSSKGTRGLKTPAPRPVRESRGVMQEPVTEKQTPPASYLPSPVAAPPVQFATTANAATVPFLGPPALVNPSGYGPVPQMDTAAVDALFDRLDQNHSGVLTRADFEAAGLVRPGQLSFMAGARQ